MLGPPDLSTVNTYKERCRQIFPFATAFKASAVPDPSTSSSEVTQVKEVAAKNISASGGGTIVLKATALSSAAMSDLSGDINDAPLNPGEKAVGVE